MRSGLVRIADTASAAIGSSHHGFHELNRRKSIRRSLAFLPPRTELQRGLSRPVQQRDRHQRARCQRVIMTALIVLEALGIAVVGSVVGYALGSYLIGYAADSISATNTGWTLPYAFPWSLALGLAPLLVVVTVLAAVYPARLALSVSPAEALEFE